MAASSVGVVLLLLETLAAWAHPLGAPFGELRSVQEPEHEVPDLVVFVGRRIRVREVAQKPRKNAIIMYERFEARYQVLSVLFGSYGRHYIDFTAFDHYGRPKFAEHDFVLLYVTRNSGRFFHELYQYNPVYRTADGRWAGCGDPYQNETSAHRGDVQAQILRFSPQVTFDMAGVDPDAAERKYPQKYFDKKEGLAVCQAGAYAEELFEIKRAGVLKARGLFR